MTGTDRRALLRSARLYLCTPVRPDLAAFLDAVLGHGVDVVQLRDKDASDDELIAASQVFRDSCDRHGALFVLNDRPDLVGATEADGVHLGQDDGSAVDARKWFGAEILIGRSTHSTDEIDATAGEPVDYLGVGPVRATPTKPGRAGVGLGLVTYAAQHAGMPFFVTGGMDEDTLGEAKRAGAYGIVVVRALTEAEDPAGKTDVLRRAWGAVPA